jgi:hypothetical protein
MNAAAQRFVFTTSVSGARAMHGRYNPPHCGSSVSVPDLHFQLSKAVPLGLVDLQPWRESLSRSIAP